MTCEIFLADFQFLASCRPKAALQEKMAEATVQASLRLSPKTMLLTLYGIADLIKETDAERRIMKQHIAHGILVNFQQTHIGGTNNGVRVVRAPTKEGFGLDDEGSRKPLGKDEIAYIACSLYAKLARCGNEQTTAWTIL